MKKFTKLFALSVSSVLALSLLAGCGETGGNNSGNSGNQGGTGNPSNPELPGADVTGSSFADEDVTLTLDASRSTAISESLFGVFLEDINYAGYLLDDNLIMNGSFETFNDDKTLGWNTATGTQSLTVESTDGVLKGQADYAAKGVNAKYAKLVTAAGGGITSKGHSQLPIALTKDVDYVFSAFVKSSTAVNMTVSLKGADSTYAETVIPVKDGNTWVKYQTTLKSNGTADSGVTFSVTFDAPGTYYLDGISLETTQQTGGIKQYVYDAIKELGPKFIRFPGGCIIEGDSAAGGADTTEIYDWKNSIGAVQNGTNAGDDTIPEFTYTLVKDGQECTATTQGEWITRRQNGDLWGYDMEYGVGFYEFFTLCDSLGASAVPVLNCGLSDQGGAAQGEKGIKLNGRHGKKVEDYIQDAIDLIEFAKGDKTTKWGALRAALGHEEPFAMDYLGIGNEQSGDVYYVDCYEKFLASAKFKEALSKYKVEPIVGNGMFIGDCQDTTKLADSSFRVPQGTAQKAAQKALKGKVIDKLSDYGVHDQHYYVNWTDLLSHYNMYDSYDYPTDDGYYGVFVGEYSANEGNNAYPEHQNQLITALGEAVMMTAFETHGNVIQLAAYAPMFGVADKNSKGIGGNDGANQWDVDMMYYSNTKIVRTANYYVQQMFMQNLGKDCLYRSKLSWSSEETFQFPAVSGTPMTFNKIYYVASRAANGDLLVKVVNISGEPVKMNIEFTGVTNKGIANVTELSNSDYKAVNNYQSEAVKPVSSTIGWKDGLGYEFKPYSLTVLRIPTQG